MGVPQVVLSSISVRILLIPKSDNLSNASGPFVLSKIFYGFMSLCTTPIWWQYLTASISTLTWCLNISIFTWPLTQWDVFACLSGHKALLPPWNPKWEWYNFPTHTPSTHSRCLDGPNAPTSPTRAWPSPDRIHKF
jgi:hypothetical protein